MEQQRNRLATIQGSRDAARGIDPQTLAQYLVGTGELRNRSYDFNDHEIKVLRKDGTCLPIAQVSDQLDRHFLQKTVTKHYLFFPKTI